MTIESVMLGGDETWHRAIGLMVFIGGDAVGFWSAMEFPAEQFLDDFQNLLVFAYPNGDVFALEVQVGILLATAIDSFVFEGFEADREAVITIVDVEMEFDDGIVTDDDFRHHLAVSE